MKHLIFALFYLFNSVAFPASDTRTNRDQVFNYVGYEKNFVKNPGIDLTDDNITDASGIASRTVSTVLEGDASLDINASSSGQKVIFTLTAAGLDNSVFGRDCEFSFLFKGDASLYKFYPAAGGSAIVPTVTLTNETLTRRALVNFPCGSGSGGDITGVIESTGNGAQIFVDKVYLGAATNIGTVAQATQVGKITWAKTANCMWSRSNTALGAYSADTDCPSPTVTGALTAPGTKIPAFIFSGGAGCYVFRSTISPGMGTAGAAGHFAFSDGTNTSEQTRFIQNGASVTLDYGTLTGSLCFTSSFSSKQIDVYAAATTGAATLNCDNTGPAGSCAIEVFYFPTQSQQAVQMMQSNTDWVAFTPTGSWSSNTTYTGKWRRIGDSAEFVMRATTSGAPTSATLTFNIPSSVGVIDTAKILGTSAATTGENVGEVQVYDDSVIDVQDTVSGIVKVTTSSIVEPLVFAADSANNHYHKVINATAPQTFAANDFVEIKIKVPISGWTGNQNAPLLVGGVTSSSSGLIRVETASISAAGTVSEGTGDWINGNCSLSTSTFTCTLISGIFSVAPKCQATIDQALPGTSAMVSAYSESTTQFITSTINAGVGNTAYPHKVECIGPR